MEVRMLSLNFGLIFGFVVLAKATFIHGQLKDLETIQSWKLLEYGFPTPEDRQRAIDDGNLVNDAGTPIDVGVDYRADGTRRLFVTVPRFSPGIPHSLGVVSNQRGANGPLLEAYPDYSWHSSHGENCDAITSAFRVAVDECNRMWVVDSGQIDGVQHCPPQLLVFNLTCNTLLHRYKFPREVYTPIASLFISPIVDVRDPPPLGRCSKTIVYTADVNYHGIVVYDMLKNASWRVENKRMYPNPDFGTHKIAGERFDLMDGIFGLSLDPPRKRGERYLYFHALASDAENAVPLHVLNDESIWSMDPTARPNAFAQIGKRGVQCAAQAMDSRGNLYCVTMDPIKLFSWNIDTPYTKKSFRALANDIKTLQFASGMKVVRNRLGQEELWILTCRFQKIASGTQNANEINFRILACKIDDLLNGKGCNQLADQLAETTSAAPYRLYPNLIFSG